MSNELESKFQNRVINLLRKRKCYVYKNAQSMYTEKGRPDLTVCIPIKVKHLREIFDDDMTVGLYMGLELKRKGHLNEVSDAQLIVGHKIEEAGGIWLLADDISIIEQVTDRLINNDV